MENVPKNNFALALKNSLPSELKKVINGQSDKYLSIPNFLN